MDDEHDNPTEVASELTELAGVAEADTQSAYAWSLDDGVDEEPDRKRPFFIVAGAVCASLSLAAIAGVLGYRFATDEAPIPVAVSAPATTSARPAPMAAPPAPPPPPVTVTTVVVESKVALPPPPPPRLAPVMSRWSYDVRWGGMYGITVIEHAGGHSQPRYVTGGENLGMGTGWTGDVIGADPVIDPSISWAECTLYIDGVMAKRDYASSGDGHDVSCLMRLTR